MSTTRLGNNLICEFISDGYAVPKLTQPWWKWESAPYASFVVRDIWHHEWQGVVRLFDRMVATPEVTLPAIGLGGVYVNETARGEGVGLAMMQRCCERLYRLYPYKPLVLWSSKYEFYKQAGFTQVEAPELWMRSMNPEIIIRPGHCTWRVVPGDRF